MRQVACNATLEGIGQLNGCRYVLHDRDAKFCSEFRETLAVAGVKCLRLPPRSPNWNAFAERWVRSVKEECLSHLILFGERSLRRALIQFQEHYHAERNHQGKSNVLLFPAPAPLEPGRRTWHPLSRTSWRPTPLLQSRRMNILTKRGNSTIHSTTRAQNQNHNSVAHTF